MAEQSPDLFGNRAALWDLEEWVRGDKCCVGTAILAPTAVAAAIWQLSVVNNATCYIEDVLFSTDTAIAWALEVPSAGQVLPAVNMLGLGPGFALIPDVTLNAGIIAPPAAGKIYVAGFAAAGFCGSILGRLRPFLHPVMNFNLRTANVAANCSATFLCLGATG